jgi:hypothetical protein
MADIVRHSGINIGGHNLLSWVFKEDVEDYQVNFSTLYCSVKLKPGKSWHILYSTPESTQLDSEQTDTPAGIKFSYKLKTLVPKDRSQVESDLFKMNGRHLILQLADKNGTIRILGTLEITMKLSSKLLKPALIEGYNGYEVQFWGEFPTPAFFIQSPSGVVIGNDLD